MRGGGGTGRGYELGRRPRVAVSLEEVVHAFAAHDGLEGQGPLQPLQLRLGLTGDSSLRSLEVPVLRWFILFLTNFRHVG